MSRLRQYFASRYRSSEAVDGEFANVIRYLNSAELGSNTLRELLLKIFNVDGTVDLDIKFRFDATTGIEARVGEDAAWEIIVPASELRGAPGVSIGTVESPIMFQRVDFIAAAAQQIFPYIFPSGAVDVLVFVNGLLQAVEDYTADTALNTVTLDAPRSAGDKVTIYSMRDNAAASYRRQDFTSALSQSVFPFPHGEEEEIVVYRNGILQRKGAGYDYITSSNAGVVTMTTPQPAGTVIAVLVVDNVALRAVVGLMLEEHYCENGLIRFDRIAIDDDEIPTAKVDGLVGSLGAKIDCHIGPTAPPNPATPSLWINTALPVPRLFFYDGTNFLDSSPNGLIPLPQTNDVLKFLRLNSTASALEFAHIDFSGLVGADEVGNPGGVAPLNANAQVPNGNLPDGALRVPLNYKLDGAVADGTYTLGSLFGNIYAFDKACLVLNAGAASAQLVVGGVNVGAPISISTAATPTPGLWTTVSVNAKTTGKIVSVIITGASGASGLTVHLPARITE